MVFLIESRSHRMVTKVRLGEIVATYPIDQSIVLLVYDLRFVMMTCTISLSMWIFKEVSWHDMIEHIALVVFTLHDPRP